MALVAIKIKCGQAHDIYALEENGDCEMLEFLNELQRSDFPEFAKLIRLFDWTADSGQVRNPQKFKPLRDKIWEFKTFGGIRVLCFFDVDKLVILTNGFKKKKDYTEEIDKAVRMRARYLTEKHNDCLTFKMEG